MAQALDYEVLVCEPREEYKAGWSLPGVDAPERHARRCGAGDPARRAHSHRRSHARPQARRHGPDGGAQFQRLLCGCARLTPQPAGPQQRMAEHFDLSEDALSRLHGPIGLRLGAKTPSEIAVSIVAELVQVKNKGMSDAMVSFSTEADAQTEWRAPTCPV